MYFLHVYILDMMHVFYWNIMKHFPFVPFRCHATWWVLLQCQQLSVHKHSGQIQVLVFKYFPGPAYWLIITNKTKSFTLFSLQFAVELAELLQDPAPKEWKEVADQLKIPFDEESQYHPEYDGYIKGVCFVHFDTDIRKKEEMSTTWWECLVCVSQVIQWSRQTRWCWDTLLVWKCPQRSGEMTWRHTSQWQTLMVRPWHGWDTACCTGLCVRFSADSSALSLWLHFNYE